MIRKKNSDASRFKPSNIRTKLTKIPLTTKMFSSAPNSIRLARRLLLARQCPKCAIVAKRLKSINSAIYRGRSSEHNFPAFQRFTSPDSKYEERTMFVRKKREIVRKTGSSEFLFGISVVLAALAMRKRQFHTLFVYNGTEEPAGKYVGQQRLLEAAKDAGVKIQYLSDAGWFDSITNSRPHNGVILECERFQSPNVESLPVVDGTMPKFEPRCSVEDATIEIKIRDPARRYPFILVLDEIVDGGNLGAILRSAYFFGVDAVVLNTKKSAPITPIAAKTSSGASEVVPLLKVNNMRSFIENSTANGWMFYGAMPPPPLKKSYFTNDGSTIRSSKNWFDMKELGNPVAEHATALVFGNEGSGLGPHLCEAIGRFVTVSSAPYTDIKLLDSLNVAVSAAVLCERFLQAPPDGKAISFWDKDIISKTPKIPYTESNFESVPRLF